MDTGSGRFVSMDSFAGFETAPLSLHKYLYGEVDAVNNIDPSGHFIAAFASRGLSAVRVGAGRAWGAGLRGYKGVGRGLQAFKGKTSQAFKNGLNRAKNGVSKKLLSPKGVKSTAQANKAAGDKARDVIAARTGGVVEKNFRVTGGFRRVDVLNGTTATESKVGRTGLTRRVRQELARDVKLLDLVRLIEFNGSFREVL